MSQGHETDKLEIYIGICQLLPEFKITLNNYLYLNCFHIVIFNFEAGGEMMFWFSPE